MSPAVPTRESGTVMPGMIVAHRLRRNRKITITTKPDGDGQRDVDVVNGGLDRGGAIDDLVDCDRSAARPP